MIPSSHQLSLKLIEKCPSCQSRISMGNIHVINETEINILTHMNCSSCHNKYLTFIVHHPQGLVGNAILTDLSYDEALTFNNDEPMTDNDILEILRHIRRPNVINNIKLSLNTNERNEHNE